jgi:carboxymethylenebutenolidase
VFALGFCFGGSNSWHQAAAGHRLAGAIGFYGNPKRPPIGPIERVAQFECPVLALMAGDDPGIPSEVVGEFRAALAGAGVEHEVIEYPGAPHSFFDRNQDEYASESADAWRRSLDFIARHS